MDRKRRRGPPVAQDSDEEESEYSRSTLRSEAQSARSAPRADDDEDDIALGDIANAPAVPPGAMPPPPPRRRARRNRVQPGDAQFVADAPPDMDPLFLRRRFPLVRELTPEQAQALHQRKEARKEVHRARALAHRKKRAAEMAAYIAAGGEPPRRSTRYESLIDQHEKWMRKIHEDEEKIRHLAQWGIDNEESAEADDRILHAKEELEVIKEDIQSMLEDDPTLAHAYDHSAANIKWIAKGQPKGRGFEDGGAPKGAESKDLSGDEVKRLAGGGKIMRYPDLAHIETWDDLVKNPKRAAIILFLTESATQGHWICAFEGPDGAHVFDPIGMALDAELGRISAQKRSELGETTPQLHRLLETSGEPSHVSRVDFQKDAPGINTCGRWVGFRLKHSDKTDAAFASFVKAGTAAMGKGATCDDFVTAQTSSANRGTSELRGDGAAGSNPAPAVTDSFQASSVVGGGVFNDASNRTNTKPGDVPVTVRRRRIVEPVQVYAYYNAEDDPADDDEEEAITLPTGTVISVRSYADHPGDTFGTRGHVREAFFTDSDGFRRYFNIDDAAHEDLHTRRYVRERLSRQAAAERAAAVAASELAGSKRRREEEPGAIVDLSSDSEHHEGGALPHSHAATGGNMYGMGGWGEQILSLMPGYHSQEDVVRGASNGTIGTKHQNDDKSTLQQVHELIKPVTGMTPMPINGAIDQSLKAAEAIEKEKARQKGGGLYSWKDSVMQAAKARAAAKAAHLAAGPSPHIFGRPTPLLKFDHGDDAGAGFFDSIKKAASNAVQTVSEGAQRVQNAMSGVRKALPPSAQACVDRYADWTIVGLTIRRDAVQPMLNTAMNVVSGGQWDAARQANNVDKIYHLGILCKLRSPDGSQYTTVLCEKNAVINIGSPKPETPATETQPCPPPANETFGEFISKAEQAKGDAFYLYDAFTNNCQDFIASLLSASGLYTPQAKEFLKQDLDAVINAQPGRLHKVANFLTDTGARMDRVMQGGSFAFDDNTW